MKRQVWWPYVRDVLASVVGSITVAASLAPVIFDLIHPYFPSITSRGRVIVIPYFPLQIFSAIVVATVMYLSAGVRKSSCFVWVAPTLLLLYKVVEFSNTGWNNALRFLFFPPAKMVQIFVTVPFITSVVYSIVMLILYWATKGKRHLSPLGSEDSA